MNEPIDQLHEDSLAALLYIRLQYRGLRNLAAQWEPRPWPHARTTTTSAARAATNEQESHDAT